MKPKRKLLVVAGAGASMDFGMPSVAEVDSVLSNIAQAHFPLEQNPASNLYDFIRDNIAKHWRKAGPTGERRPNFEDVLYVLLAACRTAEMVVEQLQGA